MVRTKKPATQRGKKKKSTSRSPTRKPVTRKRLSPQIRRAQIVDAAAGLVVEQGFLPLPTERLARAAGASKALIYTYFPTQYELFNALIERELSDLMTTGLDTASSVGDLEQAALLCAMLYFEHVVRHGPLLHILLSDRYMDGRIRRRLLRVRSKVLRRLTRTALGVLPLSRREVLVSIEMMTAIPEEAGSLVFHNELEPGVARQLCHSLVLSCIEGLRSPDRALAIAGGESR